MFGSDRKNSAGLDLTVQSMREPLLAALATTQVPTVAEHDLTLTPSVMATSVDCYKAWSKTAAPVRADILRRAADSLDAQTPHFCALLVKEIIQHLKAMG